jgi:hypothetical protein
MMIECGAIGGMLGRGNRSNHLSYSTATTLPYFTFIFYSSSKASDPWDRNLRNNFLDYLGLRRLRRSVATGRVTSTYQFLQEQDKANYKTFTVEYKSPHFLEIYPCFITTIY